MMRLILIAIASSFMFGCATHYPNTLNKNVTINLKLEKNGGIFTSAEAVAGVNDYKKDCSTDYKGFVTLHQGKNELGLAIGKPTLLIVEISHNSFGGNGRSVQRGTVLTPKAGARYQIDVSYVDAMFDYKLYEISQGSKQRMDVVTTPSWCRS